VKVRDISSPENENGEKDVRVSHPATSSQVISADRDMQTALIIAFCHGSGRSQT
jgi:hypothetical protein